MQRLLSEEEIERLYIESRMKWESECKEAHIYYFYDAVQEALLKKDIA